MAAGWARRLDGALGSRPARLFQNAPKTQSLPAPSATWATAAKWVAAAETVSKLENTQLTNRVRAGLRPAPGVYTFFSRFHRIAILADRFFRSVPSLLY